MGIGSILFLVVLVFSAFFFIYLLVKTASRWGILHSILVTTLFIECWVFLVMVAGVQDVRVPATKAAFTESKRANEAEKRTEQLQWGNFSFGEDDVDAVLPLKGRVRQLTADRGRVWRGVEFLQESAGDFDLQMAVVQPADGQAAVGPSSESLPQGLVVYAFGEEITQEEDKQYALPKYYLGEFSVKASQSGQITLAPLRQMARQQQRASDGSTGTWTLYEVMPLDSHLAFAAQGSSPTDEEIFGRMDEDAIAAIFADLEEPLRSKVIEQYTSDGKKATETTPQGNLWVQLQLKKDLEIDVDSGDNANATERGYYDPTGRAIDDRIKSGERIKLTPDNTRGELVVVKEEAVESLSADAFDIAQRVNVRQLNDYEKAFNEIAISDKELDEQRARVARDAGEITKSIAAANEMIVFRQQEAQQLAFDWENVQKELNLVTRLSQEANDQLASMQNEMNDWYKAIQQEHARRGAAEMSMISN